MNKLNITYHTLNQSYASSLKSGKARALLTRRKLSPELAKKFLNIFNRDYSKKNPFTSTNPFGVTSVTMLHNTFRRC